MICQIACRCGLPPSVIADTWSPEELRQAEALARLEGWGQEKRRTASILAELRNAFQFSVWMETYNPKSPKPPPVPLTESHFLPRRQRGGAVDPARQQARQEARAEARETRIRSLLNGLCGFGS